VFAARDASRPRGCAGGGAGRASRPGGAADVDLVPVAGSRGTPEGAAKEIAEAIPEMAWETASEETAEAALEVAS